MVSNRFRTLIILALVFVTVFLGYYFSNPDPSHHFQHELYLAGAILKGSFDVSVSGIPDYYQDVVRVNNSKFVPFLPGPAFLLLPFVLIWGMSFSQIYFSMFLGAVNAALLWYLFGMLNINRMDKLLLVSFFSFGTVHFFAATTGTVWYYNHIAAVFFLFLALISLFRNASGAVVALFLGLAYFSRQVTILSAPFFIYWIWRRHQKTFELSLFCAVLVLFVVFSYWLNYLRFGSFFDSGYATIAKPYIEGGWPYSFYRQFYPGEQVFKMFGLRNIPLNLYVLFLMPPDYSSGTHVFRPSPFGMSIFLTSPAFIYAVFARKRRRLILTCWLAIVLISVPLLLYFNQGWMQFGYRYVLDFIPFLMIITAMGFEGYRSGRSTLFKLALILFSIIVNCWGRYWGTVLGW